MRGERNNFSIGYIVNSAETLGLTDANFAVWLVSWLFLKRGVDEVTVIFSAQKT
jgi:hypothetical protein